VALTVPDESQLEDFTGDLWSNIETLANIDALLEQATDLMFIAVGLTEDPVDAQELRITQNGILAMAEALARTQETRAEGFGPFSSERIGSYSYTKLAQSIKQGQPTGVFWFDQARDYWYSKGETDLPETTSTKVFEYDDNMLVVGPNGERVVVGPAAKADPYYHTVGNPAYHDIAGR
jgi:hypothetical protein